jgi:hypothetical protein
MKNASDQEIVTVAAEPSMARATTPAMNQRAAPASRRSLESIGLMFFLLL